MAETSVPSPATCGTVRVSWLANVKYAGSSSLALPGRSGWRWLWYGTQVGGVTPPGVLIAFGFVVLVDHVGAVGAHASRSNRWRRVSAVVWSSKGTPLGPPYQMTYSYDKYLENVTISLRPRRND